MRPKRLKHPGLSTAALTVACAIAWTASPQVSADTYVITLDPAARSEPATGRVILFFITEQGGRWDRMSPMDGPFFDPPQPIASVAVENFGPGDSVAIHGWDPAFPGPLDSLNGTVRVQAVLDADQTERSHSDGPGNVYSDVVTLNVSPHADQIFRLRLTNRVEPAQREDQAHVKWVRARSQMLSDFYGRDVYHRAGVALPPNYDAEAERQWPAIYVIPGFGGRDDGAEFFARLMHAPHVDANLPDAVYIVLDPEAPLGHHTFADSANNGPRGAALVQEFIPHLESQFRLVPKTEARIITGHSSGGWASLWVQLNYPDTFGACWSSAPDPIDFTAFQMTDIYGETNMFADAEGNQTPSYRHVANGETKVMMTVRQEVMMEQAIDPDGRSGQQWDSWISVFSPRDSRTSLPAPMFDRQTGKINPSVALYWSRYDMNRMVQQQWETLGPIVLNRVRLACGDLDSYYLNRAVERFAQTIERLR